MTWWRTSTWTLRSRLVALCLALAAVLAALGGLAAAAAARSTDRVDQLINVVGPMRTASEQLNVAALNQETGIRGYAISGRPHNLEPYTQGVASEKQLIAELDRYLGSQGDPGIRAALQQVRQRADAWRAATATPVLDAVRTDGPKAAQALVDASATARFDALRAAIAALQQQIVTYRDNSVAAIHRTSSTLGTIEIAAAGIVLLAGVVLLLLIDRLVTRPVLDLAAQVREVAKGDFDRPITTGGALELAALARDVDGMRRQIAAELSEVRTARAQIEWVNDQLKIQTEELTRSNRDLEQFAYVASHDLQEPLRKVASFCQLLQRRYAGQLDDRADQYIAFAVDGAQRMQRLINDLLAFSRIGRLTAGFTDVDLNRVLTEVTSQLEARLGEQGEIIWSGLPVVEGEEPLLTTLFVNLIGNSLKFRRPDVPPVVRVSAERTDDEWRITVRDNGIGIEPEFADKVFVIFQRLHARDAYEGTGIGLAIVKKIVEYHGGRIWLDLDAQDGTSINFTLPILPGATVPEPTVPAQEQAPHAARDDEPEKAEPRKEVTA